MMNPPGHPAPSHSFRPAVALALATWMAVHPVLAQAPASSVDAELVRQLLGRIEQLEKREAARAKEEAGAETRRLQQRVAELESKLQAIEQGGKVLPEIAVTPADGPTPAELQRKIQSMEEREASQAAAAKAAAAKNPVLSVGAGGIQFRSADTNFTLALKGLLQTDGHAYFSDNPLTRGNDTLGLRRARLYLRGTLYRDISYEIIPQWGGINDLGSSLQDAFVAYRVGEHLEFKAGKFKGPVGLGLLQSGDQPAVLRDVVGRGAQVLGNLDQDLTRGPIPDNGSIGGRARIAPRATIGLDDQGPRHHAPRPDSSVLTRMRRHSSHLMTSLGSAARSRSSSCGGSCSRQPPH